MLKEAEWNTISNVLLELYTITELELLAKKLLGTIQMLVPFSKGFFIFFDDEGNIDIKDSVFVGFDEKIISQYLNNYYEMDYLHYLYDFNHETTVYKDSVFLDDSVRQETEFFQKFMKPLDIPFGSGILIIKERRIIGIFNLFRSTRQGDFTEKDIYVLNVLKKHLENMLSTALRLNSAEKQQSSNIKRIVEYFSLSVRESDVLMLILDGKSNCDISKKINVSLSTVKKHVYNIFNKVGVNSRTQLVNTVYFWHS